MGVEQDDERQQGDPDDDRGEQEPSGGRPVTEEAGGSHSHPLLRSSRWTMSAATTMTPRLKG